MGKDDCVGVLEALAAKGFAVADDDGAEVAGFAVCDDGVDGDAITDDDVVTVGVGVADGDGSDRQGRPGGAMEMQSSS